MLQRAGQYLEGLFLPKAWEVMASPVVTVGPEISVIGAVEVMVHEGIGSVVVAENEEPVGIFTRHDIMNRIMKANLSPTETKVKEVMSKSLITVRPRELITKVVSEMQRLGVTHIIVMDKGRLKGIITQTDIRLKFSQGYYSHRLLVKKFAIDTIAYITFWSGFAFVIQVLIVGIEWQKYVTSSALGFVLTILLGGPFGRYLDVFRQKSHV